MVKLEKKYFIALLRTKKIIFYGKNAYLQGWRNQYFSSNSDCWTPAAEICMLILIPNYISLITYVFYRIGDSYPTKLISSLHQKPVDIHSMVKLLRCYTLKSDRNSVWMNHLTFLKFGMKCFATGTFLSFVCRIGRNNIVLCCYVHLPSYGRPVLFISASFLAEISVRSPRKIIIFII